MAPELMEGYPVIPRDRRGPGVHPGGSLPPASAQREGECTRDHAEMFRGAASTGSPVFQNTVNTVSSPGVSPRALPPASGCSLGSEHLPRTRPRSGGTDRAWGTPAQP